MQVREAGYQNTIAPAMRDTLGRRRGRVI